MRVPEDTELVPPRSPPSWCRRQSHLSPPSPGRVTADVPHLGWPLALHHMQEAQVCGVRWRETENPAKDQQTWGWDKDWPVKRRPRGHPIGGGGGIRRRHARIRRRQSIRHNNKHQAIRPAARTGEGVCRMKRTRQKQDWQWGCIQSRWRLCVRGLMKGSHPLPSRCHNRLGPPWPPLSCSWTESSPQVVRTTMGGWALKGDEPGSRWCTPIFIWLWTELR